MGRPAKIIPEALPERITLAQRVCYEIGTSGVLRDLQAAQVVTDPQTIAEVIALGAAWY